MKKYFLLVIFSMVLIVSPFAQQPQVKEVYSKPSMRW